MKLLFIYDGAKIILDDKGNRYTNGTVTTDAWRERYMTLGDVTFVARKDGVTYSKVEAWKNFSLIPKEVRCEYLRDNTDSIANYFSPVIRKYNKRLVEDEVKKSDYVIARIPSDYSCMAIDFAEKHDKRCVVEVVGCAWDALWNHSLKGKILAPFYYLNSRMHARKSRALIYVSNFFLQKRYPTGGDSIGCSDVVLRDIKEMSLKNRIRKIRNKRKDERIILGTAGNTDVKYKGQEYVIKALSVLSKEGYGNLEYQLIGGGTGKRLKQIAKKYNIEDKVKFLGSLPHDKVFEWMDDIDIYIQPSSVEGLCRSVVEAKSRACPVIASNAGGNPELVNNEYVFKKKNVDQLKEKIVKMISNKNAMKDEAQRNFSDSKQYSKEVLAKKREKFVLEKLMIEKGDLV